MQVQRLDPVRGYPGHLGRLPAGRVDRELAGRFRHQRLIGPAPVVVVEEAVDPHRLRRHRALLCRLAEGGPGGGLVAVPGAPGGSPGARGAGSSWPGG